MTRTLSDDERSLLNHIMMFGSDGYPVKKIGRGWSWSYRGLAGPPMIFKTKREAVASFEAYENILIDCAGQEAKHRYEAELSARAAQ